MVKIKISEIYATDSELLASSVDSVKDLSGDELKATKGGNFGFGGFGGFNNFGGGFFPGGGFGRGFFPGGGFFGGFGKGKFRY